MAKQALQQIYARLRHNQNDLGLAVSAYKRIIGSPLFDPLYYSMRYQDMAQSGLEPIAHYVIFGAAEARSTHPLFNGEIYRMQLSERKIRTSNALMHYLTSPAMADLRPSHLFDPKYYASQTTEPIANPLEHYLTLGADQGLNPFPLFDTAFYASACKHVGKGKINPLVHFCLLGAFEGRAPHYLFDPEHYAQSLGIQFIPPRVLAETEATALLATLYEEALKLNPNPDDPALINPLLHYLEYGATEEREPHPLFSTRYYLDKNPDVRASRQNALLHYILTGQKDHRHPHELFDPKFYLANLSSAPSSAEQEPLKHFLKSGHENEVNPHAQFNSKFYLEMYPEINRLNINPLIDYLKVEAQGYRRFPNPSFDGIFYSSLYKDVADSGLSALEHYIAHGASQGRKKTFFEWANKFGIDHGFDPSPVRLDQIRLQSHPTHPRITIILFGTAKQDEFLKCLFSLSKQTEGGSCQIVTAGEDTESNEEIARHLKLPNLVNGLTHEGEACNFAGIAAEGEILIFLRKNMMVLNDWLSTLIDGFVETEAAGMFCSLTVTPIGRILNAGGHISDSGLIERRLAHHDPFGPEVQERISVDVCLRGSTAVSTDLFRRLNGFDTTIGNAIYQDADLSRRIAASGLENVCQPYSRVVSLGNFESQPDLLGKLNSDDEQARNAFMERWPSKCELR